MWGGGGGLGIECCTGTHSAPAAPVWEGAVSRFTEDGAGGGGGAPFLSLSTAITLLMLAFLNASLRTFRFRSLSSSNWQLKLSLTRLI